MARGWESKAVADQLEESAEGKNAPPAPSRSAEERKRAARVESLRLSKARILDQLDHATRPAHREMLAKALKDIEREMSAMNPG
jgi:hypothetical protein